MMIMRATIDGRNAPAGLRLEPTFYSWHKYGGPDSAEIEVTGSAVLLWQLLDWLSQDVQITGDGSLLWWGAVTGVELQFGGTTIRVDLAEMYNKIKILYSYETPTGATVSGETDWSTDATSVARYGVRELIYSDGNLTPDGVDTVLAELLSQLAWPQALPGEIAATLTDGPRQEPTGLLICEGAWRRLDAQYFQHLEGRQIYAGDINAANALGYVLTDGLIGYWDADAMDALGRFAGVPAHNRFDVSGSQYNDGSYTTRQSTNQDQLIYTADTISFAYPTDIYDSADGFGDFRTTMVLVSGTAGNNGYHLLEVISDGWLDIEGNFGGTMNAESAGTDFTLTQGNELNTEGTFTAEVPNGVDNSTITIHGIKLAQRLQFDTAWPVAKIGITARKVGSPEDNLTVRIVSSSGAVPGTTIHTYGTVAGTDLTTDDSDIWVEMVTEWTPTVATDYWIEVSRDGSNAATDYYVIGLEEESAHTEPLKLWTGSQWVDRWYRAVMPYAVYGAEDTMVQVERMLAGAVTAGFISRVVVPSDSGIDTHQYRDGSQRAQGLIESLLDLGTSGGDHYVVVVEPDGTARVAVEPAAGSADLRITLDGRITTAGGGPAPQEALRAGIWLSLNGAPAQAMDTRNLERMFVEQLQVDGETIRITPRGVRDDLAEKIGQG